MYSDFIGNAIKYSAGLLVINIDLSRVCEDGRDYCMVYMEDNGPGMSEDLKERFFDRLNLDNIRAMGKGFGLCLIKMLVDDFHGKFCVEDCVPGDHTRGGC